MYRNMLFVVVKIFLILTLGLNQVMSGPLTVEDYLNFPKAESDHRIFYGDHALQFGDLWLPEGTGLHPVVIVVHGGCWMSKFSLESMSQFASDLSKEGVAVWSLEFRRVGDAGGSWPGTFRDVAKGADYVRKLATQYPLDLKRVIAVGHSSGGHLAAWLAGRTRLPEDSLLYFKDPIRLQGLVVLAGVLDLREAVEGNLRRDNSPCKEATRQIIGGMPDQVPDNYAQGSPIELLPFGIPQHNIVGSKDSLSRLKMIQRYSMLAERAGDPVKLTILDGAGHFEIVNPTSPGWSTVSDAILALVNLR